MIYFSDPHPQQAFTPENSAKLHETPCKFQGKKPRPMEIPHEFFLNKPQNLPPCLYFFWNNITFFVVCIYMQCFVNVVANQI